VLEQAVCPAAPRLLLADARFSTPGGPPPSAADVKKAYMKAARALHPDKARAGSVGADGQVVTAATAATAEALFTALAALYEDFKAKA
jgi:curved DNA-binding protein CbpA